LTFATKLETEDTLEAFDLSMHALYFYPDRTWRSVACGFDCGKREQKGTCEAYTENHIGHRGLHTREAMSAPL